MLLLAVVVCFLGSVKEMDKYSSTQGTIFTVFVSLGLLLVIAVLCKIGESARCCGCCCSRRTATLKPPASTSKQQLNEPQTAMATA